MERDLYREMDELRAQVGAMAEMLRAIGTPRDWMEQAQETKPKEAAAPRPKGDRIENMSYMHPNEHIRALIGEDTEAANAGGMPGILTYLGMFSMSQRQSNWVRHQVDVASLLSLIEDGQAAQVLASIGSNDRLSLLLALLRQPMSAAQLVERCRLSSTGQAYHHLKILQAADLVEEDTHTRGVYVVKSHRVQGLIMLLAGISDLLDPTYTKGEWDISQDEG